MNLFYVLFFFLIIQRVIEVRIAISNERWMKDRGGVEVGEGHYKWFIIVHLLFFIALFCEYQIKYADLNSLAPFYVGFFTGFIIAQIGRIWCIYSLGRFWNTKIIVLPKVALIKKGPYKYLKHPNYIIVFLELLLIPLTFGLYFSALLFPFFHLLLLTIRVPLENNALERYSTFE